MSFSLEAGELLTFMDGLRARTGAFDRVLLRPRAAALQLAGYEVRLS